MKRTHSMAMLVAAGALLAVPAIGQANKPDANGVHNHPTGQGQGTARSCAKKPTVNKGFVVKGTLVSYDAGTVTLTVTRMNKHASRSGLEDADTTTAGTQYTITGADDPFKVQLSGYETGVTPADAPSPGDKVSVGGKVAVKRAKCYPLLTVAERYGAVNVRKVKIIDAD